MSVVRHSSLCNRAYTSSMAAVDTYEAADPDLEEWILDELEAAQEKLYEMGLAAAPTCPACRADVVRQDLERGGDR